MTGRKIRLPKGYAIKGGVVSKRWALDASAVKRVHGAGKSKREKWLSKSKAAR